MVSQVRKALGANEGKKGLYTGEFDKTGSKFGYKGRLDTVLLINIKDETGHIVTDHQWFNMTKGFQQADLQDGDLVELRATVKKYLKGYRGRRENVFDKPIRADYHLSRPTNIRKLENNIPFILSN